jgi:hypothetical protein
MHQEMTRMPGPKKTTDGQGEGIPPIPSKELSAPETDLSKVSIEDLMDELHNRGFILGFNVARADEGRPEPAEVPAIEIIYDEVLAQELEHRGWECFPPDGPDV